MQHPSSKLLKWRTALDQPQHVVARAAGIPQGRYSVIERGLVRPSLDQAFQIQELTGGLIEAREWADARKIRAVRRASQQVAA